MRYLLGMIVIALACGAAPLAHAQALGVSPVGASPVYYYAAPVSAGPIVYAESYPTQVTFAAPVNMAPVNMAPVNMTPVNMAPMNVTYMQQGYPANSAMPVPHVAYSPVQSLPYAMPATDPVPRDAYWGTTAAGQTTYFRPGHPLGNLLRAFGYGGPALAP